MIDKARFFIMGMLGIRTDETRQSPTPLWLCWVRGRATTFILLIVGVPLVIIFGLGFWAGRVW